MMSSTIYNISYFWNFELPLLREAGRKIHLFTLVPAVLEELTKFMTSPAAPKTVSALNQEVCTLIKKKANWEEKTLEETIVLTSGLRSEPDDLIKTISYSRLSHYGSFWKCWKRPTDEQPQSSIEPFNPKICEQSPPSMNK